MAAIERAIEAGGKYGEATGSVGTTAVRIKNFAKESRAIRIVNRHVTAILTYSIDGGTNYFGIGPYGMIELPLRGKSLDLLSDTATTGYDVQFVEAQ